MFYLEHIHMRLLLHLMYTGCSFHKGYSHKDRPAGAFHEQFQKVLSPSKENIKYYRHLKKISNQKPHYFVHCRIPDKK